MLFMLFIIVFIAVKTRSDCEVEACRSGLAQRNAMVREINSVLLMMTICQ